MDTYFSVLDQLATLDSRFIVAGDFNATGDSNGLDSRTADVFIRHALRQHVRYSTHRDGNVLDLIITQDDDTPRGQLISYVAVLSVCFSDHHLVTCRLGVPPPPSPVTTFFRHFLRTVLCVASISRRFVETYCSHGCTDHSS